MPDPQMPKVRDESGALVTPKVRDEQGQLLTPEAQQGFWSSLWEQVNPINVGTGLVQMVRMAANPGLAGGAYVDQLATAVRDRSPLAAVPLIGPPAQKAANQLRAGNVSGSAGTILGAFGPVAVGEVLPTKIPGIAKSRNPEVARAMDLSLREGVPLGLAAASDRPNLLRAQFVADAGSLAGFIDRQTPVAQGFKQFGARLAEEVRPGVSTTKQVAGTEQVKALRNVRTQAKLDASDAAERLTEIAENHVEPRPVIRPDAEGKPTTVMVDMALPIDRGEAQAAFAPVLERMARTYPSTQQLSSKAFQAVKNIVEGDQYAPLQAVLDDLSAIGERARPSGKAGSRNAREGALAFAYRKLSSAVENALDGIGPDAAEARKMLEARNASTTTKWQVEEELAMLGQPRPRGRTKLTEIRGATAANRLLQPGDANLELLQQVQQRTPAEPANLGRAWLEDRLRKSFSHGDLTGTRKMLDDWDALGDQTKAIIFPDRGVRGRINDYMLAMKKWSESPNASGTGAINVTANILRGAIGAATGTAAAGVTPGLGPLLGYQVGLSAASLALHSPMLARIFTRDLTAPLRAIAQTGTAGTLMAQTQPPSAASLRSATAPAKPETPAEDVPAVVKAAGPGIHTLSDGSVWKVDASGTVTKLK